MSNKNPLVLNLCCTVKDRESAIKLLTRAIEIVLEKKSVSEIQEDIYAENYEGYLDLTFNDQQ